MRINDLFDESDYETSDKDKEFNDFLDSFLTKSERAEEKEEEDKAKARLDSKANSDKQNEELADIVRMLKRSDYSICKSVILNKVVDGRIPLPTARSIKNLLAAASSRNSDSDKNTTQKQLEAIGNFPFGEYNTAKVDTAFVAKELKKRIICNDQPINKLVRAFKKQILGAQRTGKAVCIVGANKCGKTTLAEEFCRLAKQKKVSFDCNGLSDAAVVEGSSYIYTNCNPGKLYDLVLESGVMNPFVVLENVDKINDGGGTHGIPTAVISRWLDYTTNKRFVDNTINIEMDMSSVNFILTAQSVESIPQLIKSKVVVIEIGNYDLQEKVEIATKFILPSILKEMDLPKGLISFRRDAIVEIINQKAYTQGLDELIKIISDIVVKEDESSSKNVKITKKYVIEYFASLNAREILRLTDSRYESFRVLAKRLHNYPAHEQTMILERAKSLYYINANEDNYFKLLSKYPKGEFSRDCEDFSQIKQKLQSVYLGKQLTESILNIVASEIFSGEKKGSVIALIGDPGTGKTYAAQTLAKLLCRKFVSISLANTTRPSIIAGVKDEFVGKIAQGFIKAGTENPVFLIDEVDKASIEVQNSLLNFLDPIQNDKLVDEYLGIEIAADKALFVLTINSWENLSWPLLDRMEKLFIDNYTYNDKIEIAKRCTLQKLLSDWKLKKDSIIIEDDVYRFLAKNYAFGTGYRRMEQLLKFIVSMCVREIVENNLNRNKYKKIITKQMLIDWFDEPLLGDFVREFEDKVGVANGLAWTQIGGNLMPIEAIVGEGNNGFVLTGSLGEVMKESASVAFTAVKQQLAAEGIPFDHAKKTIHLHCAEGAIKKEGPSAGLTIAVALYSALTNKPISCNISMSGEINLHGDILPIGGLEEKLIASLDCGIKTVLLSEHNRRHVEKLTNPDIKKLDIVYIKTLSQALEYALVKSEKNEALCK